MKVCLLILVFCLVGCGKNSTDTIKETIQVDTLTFIDPCGNNPNGYDEVLVKNNTGIMAYFEQGSNSFLTKLEDGHYVTTDTQQCRFSIVGGEYRED